MNPENNTKYTPPQVAHSLMYNPVPTHEAVPVDPQTSERTRIDRTKLPAELENYLRFTQGY